jgi:hypothetical protein
MRRLTYVCGNGLRPQSQRQAGADCRVGAAFWSTRRLIEPRPHVLSRPCLGEHPLCSMPDQRQEVRKRRENHLDGDAPFRLQAKPANPDSTSVPVNMNVATSGLGSSGCAVMVVSGALLSMFIWLKVALVAALPALSTQAPVLVTAWLAPSLLWVAPATVLVARPDPLGLSAQVRNSPSHPVRSRFPPCMACYRRGWRSR